MPAALLRHGSRGRSSKCCGQSYPSHTRITYTTYLFHCILVVLYTYCHKYNICQAVCDIAVYSFCGQYYYYYFFFKTKCVLEISCRKLPTLRVYNPVEGNTSRFLFFKLCPTVAEWLPNIPTLPPQSK